MSETKITPAYDNRIYQKFSKKTIEGKTKNKIDFCQDFGLPYDKKIPLISITYALTDKNGMERLTTTMPGILELPVEIVILAIGTEKYQKQFTEWAEQHNEKMVLVANNEENRHKVYAAADIIIIPSESDECQTEAKNAMAYGVIPVTPPISGMNDYEPIHEKGNAFVYRSGSAWGLFAGLIRALENFRFPYDWKNIQLETME